MSAKVTHKTIVTEAQMSLLCRGPESLTVVTTSFVCNGHSLRTVSRVPKMTVTPVLLQLSLQIRHGDASTSTYVSIKVHYL